MVHTTRDGRVYAEVGEIDIDLGTVEKDGTLWNGDCALCDEDRLATTKSAAVNLLEEHFIRTHTAQSI